MGAMGDIKITAMDIKITAMKIMSPMKIIGDIKITAMKIIFVIVHFCRRATQDVVCASVNSPVARKARTVSPCRRWRTE